MEKLVPKDFVVPEVLETQRFRLRMLCEDDYHKDYDAVMSSADHIRHVFGPFNAWPSPSLTLHKNRADLKRHEHEFKMRTAFAYTVVSLDESQCLGCVYINPSQVTGYDAAVFLWVREDELTNGLDKALFSEVYNWLSEVWPFRRIAFPGREIPWGEWINMASEQCL